MTSARIMLDTVGSNTAELISAFHRNMYTGLTATMAAGYGDGPVSTWTSREWVAVTAVTAPQPPVVITVTGQTGPHRHVADVENGDMAPDSAAVWARAQMIAGFRPVIYCNRSNKAACISALAGEGLVPGRDGVGLWVATLDGTFSDLDGSSLNTQAGVVAVQYLDAKAAGGPWDVSLVVDDTWMAPPQPPAATVAVPVSTLETLRATAVNIAGDANGMLAAISKLTPA